MMGQHPSDRALVIIPTYNEIENLPLIVARVHKARPDVHILVVDDEPALSDLVSMVLRYEGWKVGTAHDGASAIRMAGADKPDVVVLDADMEKTPKDQVANVRPVTTICDGRVSFEA